MILDPDFYWERKRLHKQNTGYVLLFIKELNRGWHIDQITVSFEDLDRC